MTTGKFCLGPGEVPCNKAERAVCGVGCRRAGRPEGRTQLVGYAVQHGLVKAGAARKMELERLRDMVTQHRFMIARQNAAEKK